MGRAPCCDKAKVKRGPWSPEEDAVLKTYMEETGSGGNWITLPQRAGLNRCGKSCRLRWLNYLRPEIKHGGFSTEEDGIICSLYRALGSRWSVIASRLPGRTDNDVKNYWNTKLKKRYTAQPQLGTQKALDTPITAPSAVSTPSNAPPCISPLLSTAPPFSYPYSTIDCSNSDDQVVPNPSPFPSRHPAFMSSSNEGGFFVTHSSVASTSYSPASGTPASSSTPSADCPEGSSIFADGNALLRSLVDTPTTTASSSLTMDYGSRGAGWFVQLPEADERSFVEAEAAFPSYYFNPLSPSSVNVAGWSIAGESYDGNSDACDSAGLLWDVVVDSASH